MNEPQNSCKGGERGQLRQLAKLLDECKCSLAELRS